VKQPIRFGVLHGFRNPPATGLSFPAFYRRTLGQIVLAEQLGYDHVWITEHHFVEDGYMPSPLVASGAIAALTERVMIGQDVMLLPFVNPVRLAEDLAVLDNLSDGRIMLGAGMGYVPSEFAGMGVARSERRARMDDTLEILRRAWTGDEFDYAGEVYDVRGVRVRPRPVQSGGPMLWVAAMSEAGARRAARLGANLLPQGDRAAVIDPWMDAVQAAGRLVDDHRVGICRHFVVSDDPRAASASSNGAALSRLAAGGPAPHESMKVYQQWFAEVPKGDRMMRQLVEGEAADRLVPQDAFIGDASACIAEIQRMQAEFRITDIILSGAASGPATTDADNNLARFAAEVIPAFGQAVQPAPGAGPRMPANQASVSSAQRVVIPQG
jgi:alkanesulfonate monooxygenase SsuD/methylene tetrahydromethanopterin reductase-like flavin-dependent oxidoreductase (luciferase family)